MQRILNKAKNFRETDRWDILQQLSMSAGERQRASLELKKRVFGSVLSRRRGLARKRSSGFRRIMRRK